MLGFAEPAGKGSEGREARERAASAGGTSSKGLTPTQTAEAEQVARRLHAEFRPIVASMPAEHRSASAMSRALGVDRATCQRLVGVLAKSELSARTLVELPGVEGLNLVLEAVRKRKWAGAEQLATANAAVDRMAEVLDALGGSQRKLKERLESAEGSLDDAGVPIGSSEDEPSRRALYDAAKPITGRWSETTLSMRIIRPLATDPLMTETAILRGLIGHVTTARAVPLEIGAVMPLRTPGPSTSPVNSFDARPATGSTPGVLMREFCTHPLPRVVSHNMGTRAAHVIDTPESVLGKAGDILIGSRGSRPDAHPATRTPPIGEIWSMVNFPCRALVFDTYLHRDIARRCIPGLSAHLWSPDVLQPGSSRWSTRLPGGPRLQLLAQGKDSAASAYYPRMVELTARTFEQLGWNSAEFVGYRCEVTYPVWRSGYCMAFDFSGNELTA